MAVINNSIHEKVFNLRKYLQNIAGLHGCWYPVLNCALLSVLENFKQSLVPRGTNRNFAVKDEE